MIPDRCYGKAKVSINSKWSKSAVIALGYSLEFLFGGDMGFINDSSTTLEMINDLYKYGSTNYKFNFKDRLQTVLKTTYTNRRQHEKVISRGARDISGEEAKMLQLQLAKYMGENKLKIDLEFLIVDEFDNRFYRLNYEINDVFKLDLIGEKQYKPSMSSFVAVYKPDVNEINLRLLQKTHNTKRLDLGRINDLAVRIHDGLYDARNMSMFINWDEEIRVP